MARKRRIEYAYELAQLNIERTRQELLSNSVFDDRLVSEVLPELPSIDFDSDMPLYPTNSNPVGIFTSRSDYERTLRYLDRINRAAGSAYASQSLGVPEGVSQTLLTTFVMNDDIGEPVQSEFMRRESQFIRQRENKRRIAALKEQGIEMVQTPVYQINVATGELEQVWTESGHRLMQWVPATPESSRKLNYAAQRQNNLRPIQPEIPEGAYVEMWGDLVPAQQSREFKATPQQVIRATQQDYQNALRVEGYFENMQGILDAVLPSGMSESLDPVFEQILNESPERMFEIYQAMAGKGKYSDLDDATEYIVDLDWLYRGIDTSTANKMLALFDVMQTRVVPLLTDYVYVPFFESAEDFEDMFEEDIPALAEGDSIFTRYSFLKREGKASGTTFDQLRNYRGKVS